MFYPSNWSHLLFCLTLTYFRLHRYKVMHVSEVLSINTLGLPCQRYCALNIPGRKIFKISMPTWILHTEKMSKYIHKTVIGCNRYSGGEEKANWLRCCEGAYAGVRPRNPSLRQVLIYNLASLYSFQPISSPHTLDYTWGI